MELLNLNWISVICGLAAVLLVAFLRLHWPFRYQYMISLSKNPERIIRLLEASYRRNGSRMIAMLDKSTHEIMLGNYEAAEEFIAKGLSVCKEKPTLFHQAMAHYLFFNLSAVYFYRGHYADALELALRIYQRDPAFSNALTVIVCSQARLGDLQGAIEAFSQMDKKARNEQQLFCKAEIEAARGNFPQAIRLLQELSKQRYFYSIHLGKSEIQKRLAEWSESSSIQAG